MSKKFTFLLVFATLLLALSVQAKDVRQTFRKSAVTSTKITSGKLKPIKNAHKRLTTQELQAAKVKGDKQMFLNQKGNTQQLLGQKGDKRKLFKQKISASRRAASHVAPAPVAVPYEADFSTSGEAFDDFIIINNNDDESDSEPCTWKWSASSGAYYIYNEDGVTPADDYMVLPVTLEGGKTYEVTVNAATWNYEEEFEVVAGTECTAESMTTEIIGKTNPTDENADYSGTFTATADGIYYIAIHATSAADQYLLSVYRFAIDVAPDAAAPSDVNDFTVAQVPNELKTVISFTAPTTTISGDELTENITVDILRNGEVVKTLTDVAPGSEQSYTDEVTDEGAYRYQIIPSNAAGNGRKSGIVSVRVLMPKDVPFSIALSDEDAFDYFQIVDNNGDDVTWSYSSYDEAAQYRADIDNNADDYLVSPALRLEAGKKYDVTVKIAGNAYNTERFEVVAGTSPTSEGLNISVIEPTEVTGGTLNEYTGSFTAETDGFYHVAIHAISDANAYYLYFSELSVENSAEPTAPAAPALSVTPGAEGALTATIDVTAPEQTVEGNPLSSISSVELYRDGTLIDQKTDVTPGAVVSFTDESVENSGLHIYQAIAYNESGKGLKSEKTTVYIGIDQPKAPETVNAVDHATSVDLSWTPVGNVGINGGYVNPEEVTYNIWDIDVSSFFVFFNDMIASVKNQTSASFDYNVDEGDDQDYKYFAVSPVNESSVENEQGDWNAAGVFVGKPYDSVVEGFADESLHYFWDTDAQLAVTNYSSDGDGTALALLTDEPGQRVFMSGKLNVKDAANPLLVFDAVGANNISELYIMGSVDQGQWQILQNVKLDNRGYQTYRIPLASLKNHERYAQIAFVADYAHAATDEDYGDYYFLDNIHIGDFLDYELAVTAAASPTVEAGKTTTISVLVENAGLEPASNYTVKVMAGETELLNKTVTDALASFSKKLFEAEWPTSVFDKTGEVIVNVSVEYEADQKPENNSIAGTIEIVEPNVSAPSDLLAVENAENVELTWTAPEAKEENVTEDFENGPGELTQIDGNGDGFGWNHMLSDELKSHSGEGGMQSYSWLPDGGAVHVDNWLVTPLAILDGTFSFWAAAQDGDWTDEHFAVYVSTKGNTSVDDFTQVSEEFVATGWSQQYTVDLSSYAGQQGYIAIRHFNSYDNFALVVDDISFLKAPALPVKYNIYSDQQLVATVEGESTTYTIAADNIGDGEHTFAVTAVYPNGTESKPATATITVTTDIRQLATDGKPVDVYSIDGKLLRRQATNLEGLKGAYIVNGKVVIGKASKR